MELLGKEKNISIEVKASVAYTVASLVSKGMNIITVPMFTRLLSTEEMGISTIYTSWYTIIYSVLTLSLTGGSLHIAMIDYRNRRDKYASTCLFIISIPIIITIIMVGRFGNTVERFALLDKKLVIYMLIQILFYSALDMWYIRQRFEFKYMSILIVTVTIAVVTAFFSIATVYYCSKRTNYNLGIIKILTQNALFILVGAVIYVNILFKGRFCFDKSICKYAVFLSAPMIFHSLSKSALDMSDRLMISYIVGKSKAGVYGTVCSFATVSAIVWNSLNVATIPTIFNHLESQNYEKVDKINQKILTVFGIVCICGSLVLPDIIRILIDKDYEDGLLLIPILMLGNFYMALYSCFGNLLLYKKKTTRIMIGTMISAVLNILLNNIFIRQIGYKAAAYTTAVSFLLLAFLQGSLSFYVYKQNVINIKKVLWLVCICSFACVFCIVIYPYVMIRYCVFFLVTIMMIFKKKDIIEIVKKET